MTRNTPTAVVRFVMLCLPFDGFNHEQYLSTKQRREQQMFEKSLSSRDSGTRPDAMSLS